MKTIPRPTDDRVRCEDCTNYRKTSGTRGTIRMRWCAALNTYASQSRIRCQAYLPGANDPDRRDGMTRWPTLQNDIEWCRLDMERKKR